MNEIEELHVNDKNVQRYRQVKDEDGYPYLLPVKCDTSWKLASLWSSIRSVFLPEGYPNTVSDDYIYYQAWDTVQAFASSISGSLATQAVLEGVGVGDETATPLAASITWILRDGSGMIGRILFAARFGTQLDYDCKKWRLFADVLNDVAMLIEILTPRLRKDLTLCVLCCASVSRSLVGVAGGATKAAVAQHQAKANNMADLAAKDGSQETMVNLVALLVNLTILPWLAQYKGFVFPLFMMMTFLHIFANYKAVTSLQLSTLNLGRLEAVLRTYLHHKYIPSVPQANQMESLKFSLRRKKIRMGVSLSEANMMMGFGDILQQDPYHVRFKLSGTHLIFISSKAGNREVLQAFIEAWMEENSENKVDVKELIDQMVKAGWNVDQRAIQTEGYTFRVNKHAHSD